MTVDTERADVDAYIIDWIARDVDCQCELIALGKTPSGAQVAVRCPFKPFFYVAVPRSKAAKPLARKMFAADVVEAFGAATCTYTLVEKHEFVGFRPHDTHVVKIQFRTLRAFRNAKYRAKERRYTTFESQADPLLKFFHVTDVDPTGWTTFAGAKKTSNFVSKEYVAEYTMLPDGTVKKTDEPVILAMKPPLKIASFDLECYSESGKFPRGSNTKDAIITIGTSYAMYGDNVPYKQTVHQMRACESIPGVDVTVHDDERFMINVWLKELEDEQVDVLTGYNIWGFDMQYIEDRSAVLIDMMTGDSSIQTQRLGHLKEGGGALTEKNLASAAFGNNAYVFLESPGIVQLDLLAIFRKELKLDSFTLDNVSRTYLDGFTKLDVSPKQMFEWYRTSDTQGLTQLADYCVRDTLLPIKLMDKLSVLTNQLEMAKVVCVPIAYLNTRGQQIRCYSLLLKHTGKAGYIINDMEKNLDRDKYVGATVLTPVRGAYVEDVVTCLDFASLYPSIMRAHTMCPSTIVLDDTFGALDGMEYYRIETTPGHVVSFAQTDDAVVPKLLSDLASWRKRAKRQMADAKASGDDFAASLFNAKQLALKVSMNSLYGLFGAGTGALPLLDLASAVTSTGRTMIMATKAACEKMGHRVVYGDTDSVFVIQNLGEAHRLDVAKHISNGQELARTLTTSLFKHPNELEYEKTYTPFLIFSKKRYAALQYEYDATKPVKMDVKGLQLVRRDSPPFVREIMVKVLDVIMYQRSFEEALRVSRAYILDILENRVPFDKFVVSKSLRSGYKNPQSLPHVQVAEKRKRRNTDPPGEGERIPFVIIKSLDHANDLIALRAEDPKWVQQHDLPLDILFYVQNCVLKPLETILELHYGTSTHGKLTEGVILDKIMALQTDDLSRRKESKRLKFLKDTNQREITTFFRPKPA